MIGNGVGGSGSGPISDNYSICLEERGKEQKSSLRIAGLLYRIQTIYLPKLSQNSHSFQRISARLS
jgi:hypothetical protein